MDNMKGFEKESSTARSQLTLDQLHSALGKARARLGIMKAASIFMEVDLSRVSSTIEDLKARIHMKEASLQKAAGRQVLASVKI